MKFTDKEVIKAFEESKLLWLQDRAEDLDENDDYESDAQTALDTVEYHLYWYSDSDSEESFQLKQARKLLKRTDNGKRIPFSIETFQPLEGYRPADIRHAREVIEEYESMKRLSKRLYKILRKQTA